MNALLLEPCIAYARSHPHPECRDRMVCDMFETERAYLARYGGPLNGFDRKTAPARKTCIVQFDRNKYSVMSPAVGRPVEVYACTERIAIRQDGQVVTEHERSFGAIRREMTLGTAFRC